MSYGTAKAVPSCKTLVVAQTLQPPKKLPCPEGALQTDNGQRTIHRLFPSPPALRSDLNTKDISTDLLLRVLYAPGYFIKNPW